MKEDSPMRGNIVLPRPDTTNFDIAKVLEAGPEVKSFKKGDMIYVHHGIWEPIEIGSQKGFIAEESCFATIDGANDTTES